MSDRAAHHLGAEVPHGGLRTAVRPGCLVARAAVGPAAQRVGPLRPAGSPCVGCGPCASAPPSRSGPAKEYPKEYPVVLGRHGWAPPTARRPRASGSFSAPAPAPVSCQCRSRASGGLTSRTVRPAPRSAGAVRRPHGSRRRPPDQRAAHPAVGPLPLPAQCTDCLVRPTGCPDPRAPRRVGFGSGAAVSGARTRVGAPVARTAVVMFGVPGCHSGFRASYWRASPSSRAVRPVSKAPSSTSRCRSASRCA